MNSIAAIILAGGTSNRMKRPKAFLDFDGQLTFIEKIVEEYSESGIKKIILVINESSINSVSESILSRLNKAVTIIKNKYPAKGRLYSLKLGLKILDESDSCFVQNIDNPFIEAQLLTALIPLLQDESYVTPSFKGKGGHPVLLSHNICRQILKISNNYTLRDVLQKYQKINFNYNETVLININTPSEYKQYFS